MSTVLPKFKFLSGNTNPEELKTEHPFGIITIYEDFDKNKVEESDQDDKLGTVSFDKKNDVAHISGSFIKGNDMTKQYHIEICDPLHNVALYEICCSIIQWSMDEHRADSIIFEARMDAVPFPLTHTITFEDGIFSCSQVQASLKNMVETLWNVKMCSK